MGIGLLSGREWNNTYSGGYSPFSAKEDKFSEKWLAKFAPEYSDSVGVQTTKSDRNVTTVGTATAYSCSVAVSFRRDALIGRAVETEKEEIRRVREKEMWERAFSRFAPNAPEGVKQAWLAAAQEAGIDGLGISASGKMNHITQFTVQQALRRMRGEDMSDVLGSTVQSAIRATDEALYALNHPLEPRSAEKKKNVERERLFYQKFLEKLQELDKTSAGMGVGGNDAVTAPDISEEMSDDPEESESASSADIIVKPDGTRVLVVTTDIGGMEMTMNLKIAEPTNEPYEMGEKI